MHVTYTDFVTVFKPRDFKLKSFVSYMTGVKMSELVELLGVTKRLLRCMAGSVLHVGISTFFA